MDLQTYNRALLAVGGTLAALVLLVALGVLAVEFAQNLWPDPRPRTNPVSPEQARDAADRGERLALLTEGAPVLYDSARTRFLLPISQVQLEKPERYRRESPRRSSSSLQATVVSRSGPPPVNFVLFDGQTGSRRALFDDRLVVLDHRILEDDGAFALYATVARSDTDNSGLLAAGDVESLVRVALPDGRPEVLADSLGRFASLRYHAAGDLLLADTFVRDPQDWNGPVPSRAYRIDRSTGVVEPLVPNATRERMQAILDGRV